MIDRGYIWRTTLVVVALLAVWAGLAVRLGYLHLGANEGLKRRVLQMRHRANALVRAGGCRPDDFYPTSFDGSGWFRIRMGTMGSGISPMNGADRSRSATRERVRAALLPGITGHDFGSCAPRRSLPARPA